jgi:hypothetical protein
MLGRFPQAGACLCLFTEEMDSSSPHICVEGADAALPRRVWLCMTNGCGLRAVAVSLSRPFRSPDPGASPISRLCGLTYRLGMQLI